jgi:RimJ/RimL family protein N-acetyltransferase
MSPITFTTAEEASLDAFMSVSADSQYQQQLQAYAESLLRAGYTKLAWCLLGLQDGTPAARAALWAPPDHPAPTDTVLIHADWRDEPPTAGQEVLVHAHELAAGLGAEELGHSVDGPPGPPQYQEDEEARVRLLAAGGYELLRDGLRWSYAGSAVAPPGRRLAFRPLTEVREDAFVEAIAATYEGTRDAWLSRNVEERGLLGAARADFADYQGMDHLPEWWELAYTEDGALAGVIMAARQPNRGVIAYVGVVPAQRGRRLAPELVRRGTEVLLGSGAIEILGDCDRDNVAMAKAFERAGYENFARRRTFRRSLAG